MIFFFAVADFFKNEDVSGPNVVEMSSSNVKTKERGKRRTPTLKSENKIEKGDIYCLHMHIHICACCVFMCHSNVLKS